MSSEGTIGKNQLVLVVGYDGTEPAQRALQAAADMLGDSPGRLEVVYVAHVPAATAFSAQAMAAVHEGLDDEAEELAEGAEALLHSTKVKWHFQRRNGEIAPELVAAAAEQLDSEGPSTHLVLVLGGSAHKIDRYLNSTPARVLRQDRFEVYVVP
ncbi:MAG TPA: universal stress protein [Acidimicrobiales bacterium]|jgi:nucleotide-binding universal stress UspA family protein|nr:universal stress protein [Acidimicrobiales bacterium]